MDVMTLSCRNPKFRHDMLARIKRSGLLNVRIWRCYVDFLFKFNGIDAIYTLESIGDGRVTRADDYASVGKNLNLIEAELLTVLPDCVDVRIRYQR